MSDIVLPDDPSYGPEVQVDYPGYRSTRLRAPNQPLVSLPEELHPVGGPSSARTVGELDHDLTRQHDGEPIGERIVVHGRLVDEDGRPLPRTLVEVWQANACGRYKHEVDQHPAPLDPNFSGAGRCLTDDEGNYRFITIKPGSYPWGNHENAWRPAHIHFSVFGRRFEQRLVTQMYFPGDPLFRFDPIFNSVRDPKARALLVAGSTSRARRRTGRSPTAGTSCSAAARARPRWRTTDAGAHAVADRRAVLHDRPRAPRRERARRAGRPGRVQLHGRLLDGAGDPLPDGMLEVWDRDAPSLGPHRHRPGRRVHVHGREAGSAGRRRAAPRRLRLRPRSSPPPADAHLLPRRSGRERRRPRPLGADRRPAGDARRRDDDGSLRHDIRLQGDDQTVFFEH